MLNTTSATVSNPKGLTYTMGAIYDASFEHEGKYYVTQVHLHRNEGGIVAATAEQLAKRKGVPEGANLTDIECVAQCATCSVKPDKAVYQLTAEDGAVPVAEPEPTAKAADLKAPEPKPAPLPKPAPAAVAPTVDMAAFEALVRKMVGDTADIKNVTVALFEQIEQLRAEVAELRKELMAPASDPGDESEASAPAGRDTVEDFLSEPVAVETATEVVIPPSDTSGGAPVVKKVKVAEAARKGPNLDRKEDETDEQYAKRMKANQASREAKQRARDKVKGETATESK